MKLIFHLNYATVFGEELILNILGKDLQTEQYRMHTADGLLWEYELNTRKVLRTLDYYYTVECGGHTVRQEWSAQSHHAELSTTQAKEYRFFDHWVDIPEQGYLYSSAVSECVYKRTPMPIVATKLNQTLRLVVRAPRLDAGLNLAVCGNSPALGNWDIYKAVPMVMHAQNEWTCDIDAASLSGKRVEFKFLARNNANGEITAWELADNRTVDVVQMNAQTTVVYQLDDAEFPTANVRLAGTLIPVFSLRTEGSFGVGDFGDLRMMVDWVAATGQKLLQVLPINDTTTTHTWRDSYPYSAISIFALHPQYVDLRPWKISNPDKAARFEKLRKQLNALPQVDYEAVAKAKNNYMREVFAEQGAKVMATREFKDFFTENQRWLVPYAQYCYLRDSSGTHEFAHWKGHETWNEADRKALSTTSTKEYKQVAFYYFMQYVLCTQMRQVHRYARSRGVVLKGDIPIGVNRNGCDVWTEPRYFNLNAQAGAPPDDFSVNGQNWGFPTYNWPEMIADGCRWWIERFRNMQQYFDAYRIDHVLGFFRIWEIPIHAVHGLLGQFSPALGLTRGEIEAYGLHWQEELFTEPFIADWVLERMFGDKAEHVRQTYLEPKGNGQYRMREQYNTQRKVQCAFADAQSEDELNLRDGLYALISDVLFVRDHVDPDRFHPRISVQFDFIYQWLYDSDKVIFNRLYNDYFYRRNNQFWYQEAMKKLPVLVNATPMLVCAEDLGMVPDCVAWVMNELKVLSLEIQNMPKDPQTRFGVLDRNPYRSVDMIDTHDMATLRQWWDEDWERTQDFYTNWLHRPGPAPHPLPADLAEVVVESHLKSPSMISVISMQDWFAIDEHLRLADPAEERVNIPSNPQHYWRYRMHLSVDQLLQEKDLNARIRSLVEQSGR